MLTFLVLVPIVLFVEFYFEGLIRDGLLAAKVDGDDFVNSVEREEHSKRDLHNAVTLHKFVEVSIFHANFALC